MDLCVCKPGTTGNRHHALLLLTEVSVTESTKSLFRRRSGVTPWSRLRCCNWGVGSVVASGQNASLVLTPETAGAASSRVAAHTNDGQNFCEVGESGCERRWCCRARPPGWAEAVPDAERQRGYATRPVRYPWRGRGISGSVFLVPATAVQKTVSYPTAVMSSSGGSERPEV